VIELAEFLAVRSRVEHTYFLDIAGALLQQTDDMLSKKPRSACHQNYLLPGRIAQFQLRRTGSDIAWIRGGATAVADRRSFS